MPISLEHVSFTYMKGTPFEKTRERLLKKLLCMM